MKRFYLLVVLCLLFVGSALAQNRSITGVVISGDDNEPIIGASVIVKEQPSIRVLTDMDGKFKLSVPASAKTLRVAFTGLATKEVAIQPTMHIVLSPDTKQLSEVVVTGMTKVDKRLFTGAAARVGGDKSKLDGVPDAARALEGKAAGVSVQNVSSTFGTAPKIRVRGATSIMGSSKPLWVVDGVIIDDVVDVNADNLASGDPNTLISSAIAGLNPDDIESFQVLKDGSATSIYGARAMAGVIAVTTKKGRAGTSRISYTGEYTTRLKPVYSDFNIMNSQKQMSFYREMQDKGFLQLNETSNAANSGIYGKMWALINDGELTNTVASQNDFLRKEGEYRNTDWFSELFSGNIMSNHSVSITSGTEKSSYYASLSALVDPGWTLQSKVNRYTANLNTTYNLSKSLSINMIANAALRKQRAPGSLTQAADPVNGVVKRDFDINPYSFSLNTSRTLDPRVFYKRNYAPFNIFHELDNNYIDINVVDLKYQAELKWKPIRGLELSALGDIKYNASKTQHHISETSNQAQSYREMGTLDIRNNNKRLYKDPDLPYARPESVLPYGGLFKTKEYSINAWDFRLSGSYVKDTGNGLLNVFAGGEVNSYDREQSFTDLYGLQYNLGLIPYIYYPLFKQLTEENTNFYGISREHYRNVAFFTNATYSLLGKYTFNGTLRYEGSNKLGKSRSSRWLPTWNTSVAWNVHEEDFFKKHLTSFMSNLVLKGSYSLTADRGPAEVTNSTMIIRATTPWRAASNLKEVAFNIIESENSNLTYEKKHELNLGLEAGFLDGRFNLMLDWYRRDNFDLIGPITTAGLSGTVLRYGNVAQMKSSGIEFSLSSTNIKTKDFSWVTDFVYSHATNEVTRLDNRRTVMDMVGGAGFARKGYPVRSVFSVPFLGLTDKGFPTYINESGVVTTHDVNLQERERIDYLTYSGSADPTDFGSLGNTLTYKNWKLNIFLTYAFGNVVRLDPVFKESYDDLVATPREFENRFISPGDEQRTNIPVLLSKRQINENQQIGIGYNIYNYSTARVAKGDFIRLKEISLAYNFPKSWASKLYVSDLSLKLQATNLFLLYADKKLNGQDPEFTNAGGVASPLSRQFTLTLRVGL